MRLSHEQPAPSSPPSTSLRARVRGEQAPPTPPPTLRGAIDAAALETISRVVRLVVGEHLDDLAERTGGQVASDQPSMAVRIEGTVSKAIRQGWDENRHTEPRRRDRPERNTFEPGGAA